MSRRSLETIFSEENLLAYSGACLDLSVQVPEKSISEDIDTLVIPSRGAVPFFLGMVYGIGKVAKYSSDIQEYKENLGVQSMLAPLLPEESGIFDNVHKKRSKVLLIPFTADLNIPKFDPDADNDEYTQKTREYWANVTAAFLKTPRERRKDPYFTSFVDVILREIEDRPEVSEKYKDFPKIGRFSLMDTVISGRASNHILKAFDEISSRRKDEGLQPTYSFLIVDENGSKLRPDYKSYLMRKKVVAFLEMLQIPRIISEDEGASLLGVSSLVYPSVMRASQNCVVDGREFFVGAGSWHLCSAVGGDYERDFRKFMDLIYRGIDAVYAEDFQEGANKARERFRQERDSFLEYAQNGNLARYNDDIEPLKLGDQFRIDGQAIYETSSHVIHVPFTLMSERLVEHKLRELPRVKRKKTS
ncbi:MAG: hypothetical protein ACE5ES_01070 [Candidatus Nanoarchaeia archaeon]